MDPPPPSPQSASSIPKPSGIPTRTSRLPLRAAATTSTAGANPPLKKAASVANVRASTAPNGTIRSRARTPLQTTPANNHVRQLSNVKTTPEGGTRKPHGVLPSRQAQPKMRQVSASSTKSQDEDQVGDLGGFRAASRASSRPSSRPTSRGNDQQGTEGDDPNTPVARKTRPSLSERTIESLAQLPPTPAGRRRSSFFSPEGPISTSTPRPTSSTVTKHGFSTSRSSATPRPPSPSKPATSLRSSTLANTASKRSTNAAVPRARSPTKASTMRTIDKASPQTLSAKKTPKLPLSGSKTVAGRVTAKRPGLAGLFPDASVQTAKNKTPAKAKAATSSTAAEKSSPNPTKSSAALREQIRRAKAERRSLSAKQEPSTTESEQGLDFEHADPFNQLPKNLVMRRRVDAARSEGRLNIAALGLKQIPEEVLKMYDYEYNKDNDTAWGQVVDLTRFIAADNELETIQDEVFPDIDPHDLGQDDETKGPQFGGLEHLDLHGNVLFDIPVGFRRLQMLTVLNLSRNRLMNDAMETIAQISSLRELRIAENALSGELTTSIEQLTNLEVLELQGNKLSGLPEEVRSLVSLRILNMSNNQLAALPMASFVFAPLGELYASKNQLSGTLFSAGVPRLPRLRILDVSINRLDALCSSDAEATYLPELRALNISFNSISDLPPFSFMPNVTELLAQDNKISSLPQGFTESGSLRAADFTGNDFRRLDEKIALMENLERFVVEANPLTERRFLTMKTPDLKDDLRKRLEAPSHVPV